MTQYIPLGSAISKATVEKCGDRQLPILSITMSDGLVVQSEKFKKRIASTDTANYKVIPKGKLVQGIHIDEANFGLQDIVDEGIVSPAYKVWDINSDIIFPKYLEMVLRSPRCLTIYRNKLNGSVNRRGRIADDDFLGILIPYVDYAQQEKVVKIIQQLSTVMSLYKRQLQALDTLIKARFVELFGHPDKNEKSWKMNTFGDICTVRQGLQIPISKRLTEYEEGCYEYITVQYLHGGKEREYIKNPKNTVICNKDDILMTRTGNTGMVITGVDGVFHNNFFLIDFDRNKYDKNFLVQYLNLDMIQADILRRAGISTIPDLNHGEFYKIQVFEPPKSLQEEFNDFLKQVDKSKAVVQKALDRAQLLFDSLMQKYFG